MPDSGTPPALCRRRRFTTERGDDSSSNGLDCDSTRVVRIGSEAMKTDRKKMHAAFRSMRSMGIDAKHAPVRYPDPTVRLYQDPDDFYRSDDSLSGVTVGWREGEADAPTVVACLQAAGLHAAEAFPMPGFFRDGKALHAVVVTGDATTLPDWLNTVNQFAPNPADGLACLCPGECDRDATICPAGCGYCGTEVSR